MSSNSLITQNVNVTKLKWNLLIQYSTVHTGASLYYTFPTFPENLTKKFDFCYLGTFLLDFFLDFEILIFRKSCLSLAPVWCIFFKRYMMNCWDSRWLSLYTQYGTFFTLLKNTSVFTMSYSNICWPLTWSSR